MSSSLAATLGSMSLTLVTGGLLLTRSWTNAVQRDRLRQQDRPTSARQSNGHYRSPDPTIATEATVSAARLDIRHAVDAALRRLDGTAARHGVRFEVAIETGLHVQMTSDGLTKVLDATLGHAIAQAPSGKVMIGAMRHGGRIQIGIFDDGDGPDRLTQESRLRDTIEIVGLQGGTLEIINHVEGSSVIIRFPESAKAATPRSESIAKDATDAVRRPPVAVVRESIASSAL